MKFGVQMCIFYAIKYCIYFSGHYALTSSIITSNEKLQNSSQNDNFLPVMSGNILFPRKQRLLHCNHCHKVFASQSKLKVHFLVHTGEKPFACEICGKTFSQKGNLAQHYTLHTGQKYFKCELCERQFNRKDRLRMHSCLGQSNTMLICISGFYALTSAININDFPSLNWSEDEQMNSCLLESNQKTLPWKSRRMFPCSHCSAVFSSNSSLNLHVLVHTGEKPFICDICGKEFRQKGHLKVHYTLHTGQKNFKCSTCGRQFNRRDRLMVHTCSHKGKHNIWCL
ncbi:zinc finger protein 708-like [Stegodyphus dumicola]|uniref:zinc finger protein 708-like n=1 Tax=Stegodyphus dumicola TaxID=202533 RepID=UPI0015B2DD11|nr:zinc finger protein 708-like [Stegodyphus dumicola]